MPHPTSGKMFVEVTNQSEKPGKGSENVLRPHDCEELVAYTR